MNSPLPVRLAACLLAATLALSTRAPAQCAQWLPSDPIAGVNGTVYCLAEWDPDGPGPLPTAIVVGGTFTAAGGVLARNIALFDPGTGAWSPLGSGVGGSGVGALAVLPNGELVAAGAFGEAGGVTATNIARWNGTAWASLGSGTNSTVRCLAVLPNGDLIAGGRFTLAGGTPVDRLARWDGSAWHSTGLVMVSYPGNPEVTSATVRPNGDLVVCGIFAIVGLPDGLLALWNGTTWSSMGANLNAPVYCVRALPNGDVVVSGGFSSAGGVPANGVARWDGTTWSPLGSGAGIVYTMSLMPNGDLVVGGTFYQAGGVPTNGVARWDGIAWSGMQVLPGSHVIYASLPLPNGDVVVGGSYTNLSGIGRGVGRWSNGAWFPLGTGTDGPVLAAARAGSGDIYVGGAFTTIGGVAATGIARRTGATWTPLPGLGGFTSGSVSALATLPNGDLVVGGFFTTAGGIVVNNIARWNGTAWSALGTGTNSGVSAIAVMPNGDVVVGGGFTTAGGVPAYHIARWNGTSWSPLGSGVNQYVRCLLALPNGDVVAGGSGIARWNGTAWVSLGSTNLGEVSALHLRADGSIVAGGSFSVSTGSAFDGIARWDGSNWTSLGSGIAPGSWPYGVHALASLPNGDLIAGGLFWSAGGVAIDNVARWDGTAWTSLGTATNGVVNALLVNPTGELTVAGDFTSSYVSTCPATAATSGAGCASSGGANVLTATSLPWVDADFRARGTGLPQLAVVLALTSFVSIPQGVAPLLSFFVQSPAGCDLLVAPDIVHAIGTANGIADSSLFLPSSPSIVGVPFFHQMVPVEVDPTLAILSITATNSLRLVAGDF